MTKRIDDEFANERALEEDDKALMAQVRNDQIHAEFNAKTEFTLAFTPQVLEEATLSDDPDVQVSRIGKLAEMLGIDVHGYASKSALQFVLRDAVEAIRSIAPKDEIERQHAYNTVALNAAMGSFLNDVIHPETHILRKEKSLGMTLKLHAAAAKSSDSIDKRRLKGKQSITVQHVNVESGAQAVVGQVNTPKALESSNEVPMKDALDQTPSKVRYRKPPKAD